MIYDIQNNITTHLVILIGQSNDVFTYVLKSLNELIIIIMHNTIGLQLHNLYWLNVNVEY